MGWQKYHSALWITHLTFTQFEGVIFTFPAEANSLLLVLLKLRFRTSLLGHFSFFIFQNTLCLCPLGAAHPKKDENRTGKRMKPTTL